MKFHVRSVIAQAVAAALFGAALVATPAFAKQDESTPSFHRIAVFPVFENSDVNNKTVAEIVDVSEDGNTLVYADSQLEVAGFVDITDPANPIAGGTVELSGEPTSVAVAGGYALVAVNTSPNFVAPSGELVVIEIATRTPVATLPLGGQPDAVAVSPDGRYAAVVIENERDEDLGDGAPPQAPGGLLVIVDLVGAPADWTTRTVDFEGVADLFPDDAEPEYVDINGSNMAVVTFQENNHIAIVNLVSGKVVRDFPAGTVDLKRIDTNENDLIELNSTLTEVPREPDGVTWISASKFVTADEGDLFGGGRGFTVYNKSGKVKYTADNTLEHTVARLGHYPENRSENKGNEPENAEFGVYDGRKLLFIASERSSVIFVYEIDASGKKPVLQQVLPAGIAPEGIKAIPARNLLVAASEKDKRSDGFRSVVNIYQLREDEPAYPTVLSADRADGTPIPWAALSGLAADPAEDNTVYSVHDSFYQKSRIYGMDVSRSPAVIASETVLKDTLGKLAAVDPAMVNGDQTVNLDAEGIAVRPGGGFWVASEGAGTVGDARRPFKSFNLIIGATAAGDIDTAIKLPDSTNARQVRFGYEGIASTGSAAGEVLYVAFQREWADDPAGHVRIGRYDVVSGAWTFYYYPLEAPTSPNGGWVGLSELTYLGNDRFAVIERDNQAGPDARIKRIYRFSVAGLTPLADPAAGITPTFPVVGKALVDDLMDDLQSPNGLVLEKVEGMTVLPDGTTLVVNDNDGVDDSNGETQLLRIDELF